jgi:serine/threonine-protein kinase
MLGPAMAEEPRPGLIVGGRYELIEIAGRGGMADVWRGRVRGDSGFVRDVAVKQMHQNLASQPQYVAMFVEEARVGSSLQSPNVSEIHDFVHDRGNYYMVQEWIEGIDLGSWVRWHLAHNEQTRWELVAAIGVGVLRGLAAAHERLAPDGRPMPVVHRDVSPHNVLLTTRGIVKLIDFGLALAPDRRQETTDPGIVKGKMSYLAPEIVGGGRPVPASDQFACGRRSWGASCSTAPPTSRPTAGCATAWCSRCGRCGPTCRRRSRRSSTARCRRASTPGSRRRARWRARSGPRSRR